MIRAVTLEGAGTGILFFLYSEMVETFRAKRLVCGCDTMFLLSFRLLRCYYSYRRTTTSNINVYRDALIVTSLDTLTSFIAGCTIFGILGNLAHEMGMEDIDM